MKHPLHKRLREAKKPNTKDDPFSRLPDDIIVLYILSRFTMDEGVRYSILSHRWNNLWASFITSNLIFSPQHLLSTNTENYILKFITIREKVNRYSFCYESWITNVLQAYGKPILDELTIRFPFNTRNNCDSIHNWVQCALNKGVTRLELNFDIIPCALPFRIERYSFPSIEKLQGMLPNSAGLYNLRDVCLKRVDISGDVIEFMLSHFPLERLCIRLSIIGKLRVSGASVRLKSLELVWCNVDVKISASSLTSLTCKETLFCSLHLEHVPHLSELSIAGKFCSTFLPTGFISEGYISRLKRLEFDMSEEDIRASVNYPLEIAIKLDVEELKVEIHGSHYDTCFLWLVLLIKAAPLLRKFSVKLECNPLGNRGRQPNEERYIPLRNAAKRVRHHRYLKTLEVHSNYFCPSVSELVLKHLLGVSDVLEQIVVTRSCWSKLIDLFLPPTSKAKVIIL